MNITLDLTADIIDIRDIIERFEDIEFDLEGEGCEDTCAEYKLELSNLSLIIKSLENLGGDEEWRGKWYPVTLIRDSYFQTYAQELAEDIGAVKDDAQWPYTCIDWEHAARELQYDYSSVDIDGVTYWTR